MFSQHFVDYLSSSVRMLTSHLCSHCASFVLGQSCWMWKGSGKSPRFGVTDNLSLHLPLNFHGMVVLDGVPESLRGLCKVGKRILSEGA